MVTTTRPVSPAAAAASSAEAKRRRSSLGSAPAPEPRLPLLLLVDLLRFVPQGDVPTHLALSKEARQAILASLPALALSRWCKARYGSLDVGALLRLLGHTTKLERLDTRGLEETKVLALFEGIAGAYERGDASLLPALTELELYPSQSSVGTALVRALEARRNLGLPPLTRIEGIRYLDPEELGQIWACCSPDVLTRMEACGADALEALAAYINESPATALRSLKLEGLSSDDMDEDALEEQEGCLSYALEAISEGGAPALQELKLHGWQFGFNDAIDVLQRALGQGKLPALSSLTLLVCDLRSVDMRGLFDAIDAHGGIRRLHLEGWLSGATLHQLASHIQHGGGFAQLEGLEVALISDSYREALGMEAILDALTTGAPCAGSLRSLMLWGDGTGASEVRALAFAQALGNGSFPALTQLTIKSSDVGWPLMKGLAAAFLALAAKGTPSRLTKLSVYDDALGLDCLDDLTPVFEAGALRSLRCLEIRAGLLVGSASFIEAWTALGPKVKLESVNLGAPVPLALRPRLLAALADPAFCPQLRQITTYYSLSDGKELQAALNARFQRAV